MMLKLLNVTILNKFGITMKLFSLEEARHDVEAVEP